MFGKSTALGRKVTITSSFNGFEFDYLDDEWDLNRNISISVKFLNQFDESCRDDLRSVLVYYAETKSADHTRAMASELRKYLKFSPELTELGILSYKGSYTKKTDEHRVSKLRGFFRQMCYLGYEPPESFMELMNAWRLSGNDKGGAVLSLDPEAGPYSPFEYEAIKAGANHKLAEGVISDRQYSLVQIFFATGRRPVQIASLKIKDFSLNRKILNIPIFTLRIPKAKIRGGKFRAKFTPFGLIDSIGQVITRHIAATVLEVESKLGRKLTHEERGELPLFLDSSAIKVLKKCSEETILDVLKSELLHMKTTDLVHDLRKAIDALKIISERTGSYLKVTAYRFRYTLGTRAARENAGVLTIATLLDHVDDQNAGVYIANITEFAEQISSIMNNPLARYANAFNGKLVEDEEEATKDNPNATRIPCREMNCDVGSCGTSSFCNDYAPVACYLCPKFRPWANAPHHLVLQWLVEERELLKKTVGDMTVVTINDRAILAVAQVIALCKEHYANV